MNDYSSISSASFTNTSATNSPPDPNKDDSIAKNKNQNESITAKNSFIGRITKNLPYFSPSKIGQAIRESFFSAIGHLLKPGSLSKLYENSIGYFRSDKPSDKPLQLRSASIPPENLGSWYELETMQATLAELKIELNSTHEKNNHNFKISTSDINDTNSLAALKEGYPKEAELKSKVQEQEKKIAEFEKRLSEQHHVPAFPIKPRPPVKPETAEDIQKKKESQTNYYIPENKSPYVSARDSARMRDGASNSMQTDPAAGKTDIQARPDAAAVAVAVAVAAEEGLEQLPAAPEAQVTEKRINTTFDYNALKPAKNANAAQISRANYLGKNN